MNYQRRFVVTAASTTFLLLGQAQAAEDEPLEQVVVTGTRVANKPAAVSAKRPLDSCTAGIIARGTRNSPSSSSLHSLR